MPSEPIPGRHSICSIGSDLNVHAVLSGSIKQIGGQLVINARLDDARDSHRIWGEQYVGSITDIFDMQSDIARKVSSNLHSKLAAADSPLIVRTDTRNAEAYQLYLQGLYHWNKRTAPDIRRSAELFQQAIDQDPSYAKAYAWLGFAYLVLPSYTKKLTPDELKDVYRSGTPRHSGHRNSIVLSPKYTLFSRQSTRMHSSFPLPRPNTARRSN